MNENPYAPPNGTPSSRTGVGIALLLLGVLWIAFVSASWLVFGTKGIAPAVAVIAISWFAASRTTTAKLHPINRQRMTIVELLTATAICAILHGLTVPAVTTPPRGASPAGASTPNAETLNQR